LSRFPDEERIATTGEIDGRFYTVSGRGAGTSSGSSRQGGHAMPNDERIVRFTADEIDEMRRRGEDRTDVARLDAMTEEELDASIDKDEEGEFD
jgi:hypothetical protein